MMLYNNDYIFIVDTSVGTSSNPSAKFFQTKNLKIKIHIVLGEIGHQKVILILEHINL